MNRIKLGLSLIDSAAGYACKTAKQQAKAVSSPLFKNNMTLVDDIGIDTIKISKQAKLKNITQEEFKTNYIKTEDDELRIFSFEYDKVVKIAQNADGSFNKEILDCIFDIKKIGLKDGERIDYAADMTEFLMHNGRIDDEMKQSLIFFIEKTKDYRNLDEFFCSFSKNYSFETRKEILEFLHSVPEAITTGYEPGEETARIIGEYISTDLSKQDVKKRINNLKNMYKAIVDYDDKHYNAESLRNLNEDNLSKFIDSGLIPNSQICKYFDSHADEVLSALKPLQEKGVRSFYIRDTDTLNILISDKDSQIRRIIAAQPDNKYTHLLGRTGKFDKNQCALSMYNNDTGISILLDKNTQEIISTYTMKKTSTGITERIRLLDNKGEQITEYRWQEGTCPQLKYEKITLPVEARFYTEASVPGQLDVFRMKDGKAEVLSRGFRDPVTGETIVKRNFTSGAGIKTNYHYLSKKDGSYTFNYIIRDKSGKVLMRNQRRVKTLSENHFAHTINGKKYDVLIENNTIKITEQNGKVTIIDLSEHVFEGENNEKILETLKHIPPDELLEFKNIQNPKFLLSKDASQCTYDYIPDLDHFRYIEISEDDTNKMFTYLHELGHLKLHTLEPEVLDKIKKVYAKEVELYKAKTNGHSIGTMDYLVENTEHYQNSDEYNNIGALAEVFADVNAHLKYPNTASDLAERTVKFMEDFPETIAEISKYL